MRQIDEGAERVCWACALCKRTKRRAPRA